MKLTDTQMRAVRMLCQAGSGVVTKNGTVLACGDTGESVNGGQPIHSVTWLRLVAAGLVSGKAGRLVPTQDAHIVVAGGDPATYFNQEA